MTKTAPTGLSENKPIDIFIIGGGINGCGIARDAAGRGFTVALAEMNDLASGTSSGSTKLIHGGLRYLEQFQFRLVREALREREALWAIAPHIIWPMRFVLPVNRGRRPAWVLRAGLCLYDHLGGRAALPPTSAVNMRKDPVAAPLRPIFKAAFEYSDCWVDDARLVVLNAMDAAANGAQIMPRQKVISARKAAGLWCITLKDTVSGAERTLAARILVNAAGPWAERVQQSLDAPRPKGRVRLVQGSHIIVKALFDHPKAYIFQGADGRIIFAIPYERDYTLIGTTDQDYEGDPAAAAITEGEISYLCKAGNDYFKQPISSEDVISAYAAIRPLYDEGGGKPEQASRDYRLEWQGDKAEPPLLTIYGGKITTYRKLAEHALELMQPKLGRAAPGWTAHTPLPGGDFDKTGAHILIKALKAAHPFLSSRHAARLIRAYGTRAGEAIGKSGAESGLGRHFGADLWQAEVDYLITNEWAQTADDIVWRRSKLGLRLSETEQAALEAYMQSATAKEPEPYPRTERAE